MEGINEVRRGTMANALRGARAEVERWSAKDAGIEELTKCGLRGSPTIVKQVYAPSARAEKAELIPTEGHGFGDLAQALMEQIFKRQPSIEEELAALDAEDDEAELGDEPELEQ